MLSLYDDTKIFRVKEPKTKTTIINELALIMSYLIDYIDDRQQSEIENFCRTIEAIVATRN